MISRMPAMVLLMLVLSCSSPQHPMLRVSSGKSSSQVLSPFDLDSAGSVWIIARVRIGYIGTEVYGGPGGQVATDLGPPGYDTTVGRGLLYRYRPVRLDVLETFASFGINSAVQTMLGRSLTAEDAAVVRPDSAVSGPSMGVPFQLNTGDVGIARIILGPSLVGPTPTPGAEEGTGFREFWLYDLQNQLNCQGCPIAHGVMWFEIQDDEVVYTVSGDREDLSTFMSKINDIAQTYPPPN